MRPDNVLTVSYLDRHPADAARVLENFPYAMTARLLEELPPARYLAAFQFLIPSYAAKLMSAMQEARRSELADALPSERLSLLCTFFDAEQKNAVLDHLAADKRASVIHHMQYPLDSVGSIMAPPSYSLPDDITAAEALKRIKNSSRTYPGEIFILDRSQHYLGAVALERLIKAPSQAKLGALLDTSVRAVSTRRSLASLAGDPAWSSSPLLPVVDSRGAFKGIISHAAIKQHGRSEVTGRKTDETGNLTVLEAVFQVLASVLEGLVNQVFSSGRQTKSTERRHDNVA